MLLVHLKGRPINVNIVQANTLTADGSEEDIQTFYSDLEDAMSHTMIFSK